MKQVVKIVWNALALVFLLMLGSELITTAQPPEPPDEPGKSTELELRRIVLEGIKGVNQQIMVTHYSAVDIQYTEAPIDWLKIIREEFVVLLRGTVPAGFDLQQVTEDSIWISEDGKRVRLTLPPPEVFEELVALDWQNSHILYTHDTCPPPFCKETLEAYQSKVLPEAQRYMIEYARQNGILEQAARDGRTFYTSFLQAFGFQEVEVDVTGYGL